MKEIITNKKILFELKVFNFDVNGELNQHLIIFKKENSSVHIFTDFFYDKIGDFCLINHSLNTKKNFYAYPILKFLNYIFNDSNEPIKDIKFLRLDMVLEFLNLYSKGNLKEDKLNRWRNSETVNKTNQAISYFVYWLYYKRNKEGSKKVFEMKYIKSSDFSFKDKITKTKNGRSSFKNRVLNKIVIPQITNSKERRNKVTRANLYTIIKLIELAEVQDPMLTFGIVLGAFVGLRVGDICQMNRERLVGFDKDYAGVFIDLNKEVVLRSDGIVTSNIKTKRKIPIHEALIDIIKEYYKRHIEYLIDRKLNNNIYGALFLNRNGKAMTRDTYLVRFRKIYNNLYLNIIKEAELGNKKAIIEKEIIEEGKFTPHSLRHFFTQFIEEFEEGNPFAIRSYRADKSIKTQEIYIRGTTSEQLRGIQEKIYKEIKEMRQKKIEE